jgi:hypothetical protein
MEKAKSMPELMDYQRLRSTTKGVTYLVQNCTLLPGADIPEFGANIRQVHSGLIRMLLRTLSHLVHANT